MKKLSASFFARNTVEVAQDLLGKIIDIHGVRGRIVETEAYCQDAASHARVRTPRSAIMHDTHGHVYVYVIYGMYNCLNFTTSSEPGAVLIRAVEPLEGVEEMKQRRGTDVITNLCSGPGKLCQAFGIDRNHNKMKIGEHVMVYDDGHVSDIESSTRIGITQDTHLEWRFFVRGNKFVSRP